MVLLEQKCQGTDMKQTSILVNNGSYYGIQGRKKVYASTQMLCNVMRSVWTVTLLLCWCQVMPRN